MNRNAPARQFRKSCGAPSSHRAKRKLNLLSTVAIGNGRRKKMSNSYGMLAFDIGNTNIHMGLWQDNAWRLSWRARTVHDKMPDEYGVLVRNFLETANMG